MTRPGHDIELIWNYVLHAGRGMTISQRQKILKIVSICGEAIITEQIISTTRSKKKDGELLYALDPAPKFRSHKDNLVWMDHFKGIGHISDLIRYVREKAYTDFEILMRYLLPRSNWDTWIVDSSTGRTLRHGFDEYTQR